jgi:hypothetical protein
MKTSEKCVFRLTLLVLFFLPMNYVAAQDASIVRNNPKNIAVCFPVRADEPSLSQFSSQAPDEKLSWQPLEAGLAMPQSLPNGSPYPEAVSLAKLMEESLRARAEIGQIISIDTDTLKALRQGEGEAPIFQAAALQNADVAVFMMYTIQDSDVRFEVLAVTKTGEGASYFSEPRSIFNLSDATNEAVTTFIARKILVPAIQIPSDSLSSGQSSTLPSILPAIEPWKDRPKYEQANSRLKIAIGGVAVGLSASFICAGLWQTYQEAEYRNTAFESAVTASGIATGASVAVTVAFVTSAIWNVVLMLQASH